MDGLLARVEIDVTEPARVVAIITRESAEEAGRAGIERGGRRQVDERDGGAVRRLVALVALVFSAAVVAGSVHARPTEGPATVLAAASLTEVLPRIDETARASFGGSNQLAQQARQGFPSTCSSSAARYTRVALFAEGLVRGPIRVRPDATGRRRT